MQRENMNPLPRSGQEWITKEGYTVRILSSVMPGPWETIQSQYIKDGQQTRVNGSLGVNFDLTGLAHDGKDWLVERVK